MKTEQTYTGLEIAVVGMACKFPGADTISEFWGLLKNGETSIQKLSKEQLSLAGVDESLINHPDYVATGAFVKEKDAFDHQFFKYTPNEALIMDPQIRLFHQCVWEALEDASIDPETYNLPIGIYSGAGDNFLWRAQSKLAGTTTTDAFSSEQLSAHEFISTLISYKLGLNGPALYVNTACSTSLVAIHVACRALLTGELRVALAGGIRIISQPEQGYLYEEGMIMSKDGSCRAYDKDASGTVGGEGGGVVVLKKLKDAIKDGDRIYGLIKSSAINNDGNRKIGYTAPSVNGQSECIKIALKMAGVTPENIHFLEGHGTATVLGDSIELKAIKNIFNSDRINPLLLGSLKTNLGHMDVGAGVGGFIKSILSVYHKKIPASLNFDEANSELLSTSGNMQVVTELTPLKSNGQMPIRGGVSSFGIGGTNAHLIVEEFIGSAEIENKPAEGPFLFQFSAKTARSLKEYCKKLSEFVSSEIDVELQDIAFTLNRKKKNWAYRKSIVANSKEELLEELNAFVQYGKCEKVNLAAEFLGAVSAAPAYPQMGAELYRRIPEFREEINRLLEIAQSAIHFDLKSYWLESSESKGFENQKCAYHHPLHFVINLGMLNYLEQLGIKPQTAFAHSLGEYVLASKVGVFSEKQALVLLHERGRLGDSVESKPMLSVAASHEKITSLQFKSLDITSKNSKNNCLVVLEEFEFGDFCELLEKEEINYKVITNIGLPAHSRYLDTIKDAYQDVLDQMDLSEPSAEYWKPSELKSISKREYWVTHLREMADLSGDIEQSLQKSLSLYIEIGGGQSLGAFIKDHATEKHSVKTFGTLRHRMEEKDEYKYFLDQLGKLWCAGVDIITDSLFDKKGKHISVPTYAWDKHRFNATAVINFSGGVVKTALNTLEILEDETVGNGSDTNLPQTREEEILCSIFSMIFGAEIRDRSTSFFELGGDSLKALMCIRYLMNQHNHEITIKDFFAGETVQGIAERIKKVVAGSGLLEMKQALVDGGLIPLSYNQKNYFSPLQFAEENIVLDLPVTDINKEVLLASLIRLCEKHEILRVNYQLVGEEWKQRILPVDEFEFPFEEVKLHAGNEQAISSVIGSERTRFFEKSARSFIRAQLLVLTESESHIILTVHHSIGDGFSINILQNELFENYATIIAGNAPPIAPLEFSYFDFVRSQIDYVNSEKGIEAQQYWRQKLSTINRGLLSEFSKPRVSRSAELLSLTIGKDKWSELEGFVRKEKITKQTLVQSAIVIYLRSLLNKEEIVLFSTNSGRYSIGLEGVQVESLIGFFVNLIPHCFQLNNSHSNSEVIHLVHESFNEDLQYSAYPFEKMAEDNNWHNNLELLKNSVSFNYHNYDQDIDIDINEDGSRILEIESKFLLNVVCYEYNNAIFIEFGDDQYIKSAIDIPAMRKGVEEIICDLIKSNNERK
jgi:phthiocerol/phenolphthiocerol synthesis type-I polyketide synthase E